MIPTPGVRTIKDYDRPLRGKHFHRPPTYITLDENTDIVPLGIGYDVDEKDEIFLEELNAKREQISNDKFEMIMDKFEKEAIDCTSFDEDLPPLDVMERMVSDLSFPEVIEKIYNHWAARRRAGDYNGRYLMPPKERTGKKKSRKNDSTAYFKMRKLRLDLERARLLLSMVEKREKLKREKLHISYNLFQLQLKQLQDEQKTPKQPKRLPTKTEESIKKKKKRRLSTPSKEDQRKLTASIP